MNTVKIAVASEDGIAINLHFGHAKAFRIYDMVSGVVTFRETRGVQHYCHGHSGNKSAMEQILLCLQDCDFVFVAKVGDGPKQKLAKQGIVPVDEYAYLSIEDSLVEFFNETEEVTPW